ncbi:GIY-YIG nuclease family protein [Flavobacterium sp. H122]|uniref:GIY-YIG nuclease family protein n=1 Tax=Flavobacterium sp. H122 TaxID=2529860 RepID=UPI0010AAE2CC|nr:GIY-YIG nuclease family protein [Flavobacterium sp. H122]
MNDSIENQLEYKSYFPNYQLEFVFHKWLIDDGSYIEKGDYIYEYSNSSLLDSILIKSGRKTNATITKHKAEKSGYIDFFYDNRSFHIPKNQLMYLIRNSDNERIQSKFINVPKIINDDFTNSIKILWQRVSSNFPLSEGITSKSNDLNVDLSFSFNFENDCDNIVFNFNPKQLKPKQNDKILFLFDNGEIVEFELFKKPILIKNITTDKILQYKSPITQDELNLFSEINFKKWKIILKNDNHEIIGGEFGGDSNYVSKSNLIIVIKKFAKEYLKLVSEKVINYKPLGTRISIENKEIQTDDYCYVYLMQDTSNGYFKIGISNKPEYREKTLQSEKPTIEMICSKRFPIRKIAESFEKSLHLAYAEKRIRGEWFELASIDVEHIIESLR